MVRYAAMPTTIMEIGRPWPQRPEPPTRSGTRRELTECSARRARDRLTGFRQELYRCFTSRADALFEAAEAVLCRQERVHMLAELSLEPEYRRGHGGDKCSLAALTFRSTCAGDPLSGGRVLEGQSEPVDVGVSSIRPVITGRRGR